VLKVKNTYNGVQPFEWQLSSYWLNVHGGLLYDFLLQLAIAYLLFFVSRSKSTFILLQGLFIGTLYVGAALKTSIMGTPVAPLDLYAVPEAAAILGVDGRLIWSIPLTLAALLLWNLKRHWLAFVSVPAAVVLVGLSFNALSTQIHTTLDQQIERKPWDQRFNHDALGTAMYLLSEVARLHSQHHQAPDNNQVTSILENSGVVVPAPDPALPPKPARNVYLILVESLWDPTQLPGVSFSEDPFDPEFRKLWSSAGQSLLLSPVFGGQTAEAEFELLCGQPANRLGVTFVRGLGNAEQPCLPRHLAGMGYRTIAMHPNVPSFWNRKESYARIGFERFVSSQQLEMGDANGAYLSNQSLFGQAEEIIDAAGQPIFAYILTIAEHWPYRLSATHPRRVKVTPPVAQIEDYANVIRHSTRELSEFIERLRHKDPEALVIIAGDHLPLLGSRLSGYRQSGLAFDESPTRPEEIVDKYATPLVVIDGPRGPQTVSTQSMYGLPQRLLRYLGHEPPAELRFFSPPPGQVIRPLPSGMSLVIENGRPHTCRAGAALGDCGSIARWLELRRLISADLRVGGQHALRTWRHASPQ